MKNVKILAIAPYESMKELIKQVAGKMKDIDVSVFVGNLENGVQIAKRYSKTDYDVIVSRGGTAELLREQISVPVVEIPLSVNDILRAIKLAENYNNKYAIIGFPAATKNAHFLCDVLRYNIDIVTIHNENEARENLKKLSQSGCSMVLCDMITNSLAKQYGISSILITSGTESVESALKQAVQMSITYDKMKCRINFFKSLLEEHRQHICVYTPQHEPVYSFGTDMLPKAVMDKIFSCIDAVFAEKKKRIYMEISGYIYSICGIHEIINGSGYIVYFINQKRTSFSFGKNGISFTGSDDAYDEFFNSIYGIIQAGISDTMTLANFEQSSQPLMITGEEGTEKEQMAKLIYAKSRLSGNPLVTIDFSRMHERGWSFLFENEHSPLEDSNITLYFKGIKFLSDSQFAEFFELLRDLNVHKRNRILFSYPYTENEGYCDRCKALINTFSCLCIRMPSLRSQKNNISNLSSIYINLLNIKLVKEVIGFEPQALEALENFEWPYNLDQFKRVLCELVTAADSPYIKLESVLDILRRERKYLAPRAAQPGIPFKLDKTLQEINLIIAKRVLSEENGNQSATAKRLGISRATLWRMLQN